MIHILRSRKTLLFTTNQLFKVKESWRRFMAHSILLKMQKWYSFLSFCYIPHIASWTDTRSRRLRWGKSAEMAVNQPRRINWGLGTNCELKRLKSHAPNPEILKKKFCLTSWILYVKEALWNVFFLFLHVFKSK